MHYRDQFEVDRQRMFKHIDALTKDPLWLLKSVRSDLYFYFFNKDHDYKAPVNPLKNEDTLDERFGEHVARFMRADTGKVEPIRLDLILSSTEQQLMAEYIDEYTLLRKKTNKSFGYPEESAIFNKAFGRVLGDKYLDLSMEYSKLTLLQEQGMVTPEAYQVGLAHLGEQMDHYGFNGLDRMIKSNPELLKYLCATHPDFTEMQGKINAGEIAPEAVRWENALKWRGEQSELFRQLAGFWSGSLDSYKAPERFDEVRHALNVDTDRIMQGLESDNPETLFRARKLLFAKHGLALLDPEVAQSVDGVDVIMAGTEQAQGMARIQKMREHVEALVDQFSLPEYNFESAVVRFGNVRKRLRGESTVVEALEHAASTFAEEAGKGEPRTPELDPPRVTPDPHVPTGEPLTQPTSGTASVEPEVLDSTVDRADAAVAASKSRYIPGRLVTSVASAALLYDGISHYNDKNEKDEDSQSKLLRGAEAVAGAAGMAASWLTKSTTIERMIERIGR